MPVSVEDLMRRPAACLRSMTAAGRQYFDQAPFSRAARSFERGSLGLEKGRRGMMTPLRVEPGASKPSQKLLSAKSERVSFAMNSSRSPLVDTPHFWHTTRRPSSFIRGLMSSKQVSISRRLVKSVSMLPPCAICARARSPSRIGRYAGSRGSGISFKTKTLIWFSKS